MRRSRLSDIVVLLLAIPVVAFAQVPAAPKNLLTIEDALRWRMASNPVLSPDGKRVAYLVSENDFEKSRKFTHLWWVETETKQALRLTSSDSGAADQRWSPDGRWLAFVSARVLAAGHCR